MRAPRFSIRSLLAVIAISGVGLAMLRSPLPVWANLSYTVAIVAVLVGASSAILGRDSRRAYWVGFTLFGATFLMMSDQLVTQPMFDLLYPYLAPQLSRAMPGAPSVIAAPGTSLTLATPGTPFTSTYTVPSRPAAGPLVPPTFFLPAPSPTSAWDCWMRPDRHLGVFFSPTDLILSPRSFRQIGHSIVALLAAALGGAFVQWQHDANLRKEQSPEATP
jgi:hypothetical protein